MAKSTEVILLERIDPHGELGDIVSVKPGFARNYLLPQKKALRATPANKAYFDAQKKELEAQNESRRKEAEKIAGKLEGLSLTLVRQAGDKGQLYGSVSSRDISDALIEEGHKIGRSMIDLNTAVKEIGLFPVEVILHPEVRVEIEINVARNEEEAKIQKKTGKAIIADESETPEEVMARAEQQLEEQMEELLDEDALEAEKEKAQDLAEDDKVQADELANAENAAAKNLDDDKTVEDAAQEAAGKDDDENEKSA